MSEWAFAGEIARGASGAVARRVQEWLCLHDIDGRYGPATAEEEQAMNHRSYGGARRLLTALLVTAYLWSGTGCATYHIYQIGGPDGRDPGNQPSTEWETKTLHSLFWGAIRQDLPVDNCRLSDGTRIGIEDVRVESNVGATLATILTLGMWRPLKVGWRCAKPAGIRDTLE